MSNVESFHFTFKERILTIIVAEFDRAVPTNTHLYANIKAVTMRVDIWSEVYKAGCDG